MRKTIKLITNLRFKYKIAKNKARYYKVPFFKRLNMKIKGFKPDHYYMYDFKRNNYKEYINEYERYQTRNINKQYNLLLDDKLIFYEVFKQYVNVANVLAWINEKKIYNLKSNIMKTDDLYRMIKENNKILLKPNYGFGGKGIFKVTYYSEKEAIINDNKLEYKKIYDIVSSYNDYIIMQFIDQHEYSYEMYPHTTNTIRIITIMNQDGHAEIPNVVHRIGVKNSIPVDNAAKGGLFSQVNVETGELGEAKNYSNPIGMKLHPEISSKIDGVKIPNWNNIKKTIISVAEKFPFVPYLAWDVILDKNTEPIVIEINGSTDLEIIQMFTPLRYTKLGDFLRKKGAIK